MGGTLEEPNVGLSGVPAPRGAATAPNLGGAAPLPKEDTALCPPPNKEDPPPKVDGASDTGPVVPTLLAKRELAPAGFPSAVVVPNPVEPPPKRLLEGLEVLISAAASVFSRGAAATPAALKRDPVLPNPALLLLLLLASKDAAPDGLPNTLSPATAGLPKSPTLCKGAGLLRAELVLGLAPKALGAAEGMGG